MRDMAESSHDFQKFGLGATSKRGCLATHLVVAGICGLLGAAVNEASRQERLLAGVGSLQNSSARDTFVPSCGGPGGVELISSAGRRPETNVLLTTIQTAETFELSLDITPHDSAPPDAWRSIVHIGNPHEKNVPVLWLQPKSTQFAACMSRQHGSVCCSPPEALPTGEVTHVVARLVGDTFTVSLNGHEKCSTDGFSQNRVPAQSNVDVWFSDPWDPAADVTVANLMYTPLYACACVPVE
uniref:Uncharacterized protein n=2 Tax=Noctiluca scintillans TaxID=2966 RepID=A0A7S1APX1_NOCSC|mmetsp:Transcript_54774/g.146234  ORF Transcript_54774/g.146234 Transcript_54774/m.146234 type:complete len:241 (+) Transcript_54774:102-824(+)